MDTSDTTFDDNNTETEIICFNDDDDVESSVIVGKEINILDNVDNSNTDPGTQLVIVAANDLTELEKQLTVDMNTVHEKEKAQRTSKNTTQRKTKVQKNGLFLQI